jgi:hypothetical protein
VKAGIHSIPFLYNTMVRQEGEGDKFFDLLYMLVYNRLENMVEKETEEALSMVRNYLLEVNASG